jgi:uncharacterized membrane protein
MSSPLLHRLRQELSPTTRWLPLAGWLLLMVLIPVAQWSNGGRGFAALVTAGVLSQLSAVLVVLAGLFPVRRMACVAILVLVLTWTAEFIGLKTGIPFGNYQYTPLMQPQLGGVPILIPLAWLMMLPPAWGIASRIFSPRMRLAFAAASGLAFTAWDLYLDPQMVGNGLWTWEQPGLYFGIPLINFLGWWLISTVITLLINPHELNDTAARLLAVIYTLTWLLQAVGLALFWNLPLPALCGFIGMGAFTLHFWLKELHV